MLHSGVSCYLTMYICTRLNDSLSSPFALLRAIVMLRTWRINSRHHGLLILFKENYLISHVPTVMWMGQVIIHKNKIVKTVYFQFWSTLWKASFRIKMKVLKKIFCDFYGNQIFFKIFLCFTIYTMFMFFL